MVSGRGGGGEDVVPAGGRRESGGGMVQCTWLRVRGQAGLVRVGQERAGVQHVPVENIAGLVVTKSSHPGGSLGVQSVGFVLVLPVSVRVLLVRSALVRGPVLVLLVSVRVLPVSVRVLFVRSALVRGPVLVLLVSVRVSLVSVRVLFVRPVLVGLVLVLAVSVRVLFVRPVLPGPVLVLPVSVRVRVLLVRGPVVSSVRVLFVCPVLLPGPILVLPVSVRLRGLRVISAVGHSVTGGQVHSVTGGQVGSIGQVMSGGSVSLDDCALAQPLK